MAKCGDAQETLKFAPFESVVDSGFWHYLSKAKLEYFGLDEKSISIHGHFYNGDAEGLPTRCSIDFSAFNKDQKTPHRCFRLTGSLLNTNTIEKFKEIDKQSLINSEGSTISQSIVDGSAIDNPNLLNRFLLLSFADLKKYRFVYWFAFPAILPQKSVETRGPVQIIRDVFSEVQIQQLLTSFDTFYDATTQGAFAIQSTDSGIDVLPLSQFQSDQMMLGFCDPSTDPRYPGWPLRNLLALISNHKITERTVVKVLCLRDRIKEGRRSCDHSLLIEVILEPDRIPSDVKVVGWEKNHKGKLSPKMIDLSSSMDPKRLAESSVNLNLKLMRWRLQPDLDLETISNTSCLLFGSGTLGCNVARMLMGWGVRRITMLDNGRVSFSNPVRQSLFTFQDSLDGGKHKAEAGVDSMKKIYPGVEAVAVDISVPMPGHAISASQTEQVRKDLQKIVDLVEAHDVLFLLMDTREARWLPTVLGAVHHKIVINAALGFESFLVMRHGFRDEDARDEEVKSVKSIIPGTQLGCYFCSDIVAPGDSTKERTLDQQCTVSRPGLSMMAAALAVELLVSLLQHPQKGAAPFCIDEENDDPSLTSGLGIVPHQIRGFLSRFSQVLPGARSFDKCPGCADAVISAYRKEGFDFLLKVFNDQPYLEEVCGLKDLQEINMDDVFDFDDMEDMDSSCS